MSTTFPPGPWPRENGVVRIDRTGGGSTETITGHDFCAFEGDEVGIKIACLVSASTQLVADLQAATDQLEAAGVDVSAYRATIALAMGDGQ